MAAVDTLTEWNAVDAVRAAVMILPCCGSTAWADAMSRARPMADTEHLLTLASAIWSSLPLPAWQQAFESHPRIGESKTAAAHARAAAWSRTEQAAAQLDTTLADALADANKAYEERFGRIFLICATNLTADQILYEASRRMTNTDAEELHESAEEQRKIMKLRLRRWLAEGV